MSGETVPEKSHFPGRTPVFGLFDSSSLKGMWMPFWYLSGRKSRINVLGGLEDWRERGS